MMLKRLCALVFASGVFLTACTGNSTTNSGNISVTSSKVGIAIDSMSSVPVLNGSGTQGTLYIHNYTNQTVSGLNYSLNQSTFTSQIKSLIAKAGLNSKGSIEDKSGFVLLNSERCVEIAANSSCAINFITPNLSFANQGNSLVNVSYQLNGKSIISSQIVNYNYVDTNTSTGINFTGDVSVSSPEGTTRYVVGYLYASNGVNQVYKNVNLVPSNPNTTISGGFINSQDVAVNQVIAVEFRVLVQNTQETYVGVVPRWNTDTTEIVKSSINGNGIPLSIVIDPKQNTANYLFGSAPILKADIGYEVSIPVINNGNADGTTISADKIGGQTDGITVDTSDCTSGKLQANAIGTCNIVYTVNTYTPGSTIVNYKNTSGAIIGEQAVYWTNEKPIPMIKVTRSTTNVDFPLNTSAENIPTVRFIMQNIGNAPFESASFLISATGVSTVFESSTDCAESLSVNQSCYINVKLTSATSGAGAVYIRSLGKYNANSYNYMSLPISYMVTNNASLKIMPNTPVSLTAGAGGGAATQTFTVTTNLGSEPATITSISLESMTTTIQPTITGGSCVVSMVLNSSNMCTVQVSLSGPITESQNIVGTTRLKINYTGGIPSQSSIVSSDQINYTLMNNDSSLSLSIDSEGLSGFGTESRPYLGMAKDDTMQIVLTYTNNSVNYMMKEFNLDASNLPYGITIGDGNCKTGSNIGDISISGNCYLNLNIDKTLLQTSSQGGSTVYSFRAPTATWRTTVGFYSQSFESLIYIHYLQPSVSFGLSNNNGSFESTMLTITLANESAGVMPVTINISQVKPWLVNSPIASNNCSGVGVGEYSAICSLGGLSGESAEVIYIMPDYFNSGESANIPLVYTTTSTVYLSPEYNYINYTYKAFWQNVGEAGLSIGTVNYTSLAIDKLGIPYIAYADGNSSSYATVMKFNGESWINVGNPGFSAGQADHTSLAIDLLGTPYIGYRDGGNSNKATVMRFNGESWVNVGNSGFSASQVFDTSLAIDESNTPYIGYTDGGNGYRATVMKFDGESWISAGNVGFSADIAEYVSLAIDKSGTPYIAYQDTANSKKATVMKLSGESWILVGSAGLSIGQADYISLAINELGVPYIAYKDIDNGNKATVMKFTDQGWVAVGNAGFSIDRANYTSLAIDKLGIPYVGYQDGGNSNKVTVMKFYDGAWIDVGNAGFSVNAVNYTSLAINVLGIPYIGYQDVGNSDKATVMQYK